MFKRFLMIPLLILWASIVFLRLLLAPEMSNHLPNGPWPNIVFFIFVAAITGAEIAILVRARSAYQGLPDPTANVYDRVADSGRPRWTGKKKFLILVFLCCVPLALWDSRNASIGIVVPGLLAGGAFNLLFTAALANAVFTAESKKKQA